MLGAPPLNIDAFLLWGTYVSSTQLNWPVWNKFSISSPWKPDGKAEFLTKTKLSQCNKVLYAPASNLDGFLLRDTCVSSFQLNRPILIKVTGSPHWNPW
jgi:hypothetical protein